MNKLKIENHMKSRSLSAITATAYRLLSQNMKLWMRRDCGFGLYALLWHLASYIVHPR